MSSTEQKNEKLQNLINKAVKKIDGQKENDICRYIPSSAGGYIHHFTMRKMKNEDPETLMGMIEKHIINVSNPQSVTPKPRAARGSRKPRGNFFFTKQDMERLLNMAKLAGDKEMIRKLTPRKDLATVKRELIASIRHGRVEEDLWDAYVESVTNQHEAITPAEIAALTSANTQ